MMSEIRHCALVIDAKLEGGSGIMLAREIRSFIKANTYFGPGRRRQAPRRVPVAEGLSDA